jgi:hypothetical protein
MVWKFFFTSVTLISPVMPSLMAPMTKGVIYMDDADTIWMTYAEAAERLGIKAASVKRRATARKWPKRTGNDRKIRVGIPREIIPDATPENIPDNTPDTSPITITADLAAAHAEIQGLKDQIERADAERDRLLALLEKAIEAKRGPIARLVDRIFQEKGS